VAKIKLVKILTVISHLSQSGENMTTPKYPKIRYLTLLVFTILKYQQHLNIRELTVA